LLKKLKFSVLSADTFKKYLSLVKRLLFLGGDKMKSKYIVVVDDAKDNQLILKVFLSKLGYEAVVAKNGSEALPLLTTFKPSLVISDIMMPNMGGFEFLEKLKKLPQFSNLPVILMSSTKEAVAKPIAKDLSAYAFLEKPINFIKLKSLITSVLAA
jgi:CheY-like chemotaxis protein